MEDARTLIKLQNPHMNIVSNKIFSELPQLRSISRWNPQGP